MARSFFEVFWFIDPGMGLEEGLVQIGDFWLSQIKRDLKVSSSIWIIQYLYFGVRNAYILFYLVWIYCAVAFYGVLCTWVICLSPIKIYWAFSKGSEYFVGNVDHLRSTLMWVTRLVISCSIASSAIDYFLINTAFKILEILRAS